MKIHLTTLFLIFAFISVSTYEFISNALIVEKSSMVIEESLLEEKLTDKFIDDTYLLKTTQSHLDITLQGFHHYKQKLYTFNLTSPLIKPPIFI